VLSWAEQQLKQDASSSPYFEDKLYRLNEYDLPDPLKGKYYKLAGQMFEKNGELPKAHDAYKTAYNVYGAKTKTKMDQMAKQLASESNR